MTPFSAPAPNRSRLVLKIHEERRVVVEWSSWQDDRRTNRDRASGFVEVGGRWWATRIEGFDEKDRVVRRFELTHKLLDAAAFKQALGKAVAGHGDVIFVGVKDSKLDAAKQAAHEKKATFEDHLTVAAV